MSSASFARPFAEQADDLALALGLLPQRRQDFRDLLGPERAPGQGDDVAGLNGRALLRIAERDHLKTVLRLQPKQLQALHRAEQREFIDRDHAAAIEFERSGLGRIEKNAERLHVALRDAGFGQVVGLAPGERGAIDPPALLLPRRDKRLERRRLARPGRRNRHTNRPPVPSRRIIASCARHARP